MMRFSMIFLILLYGVSLRAGLQNYTGIWMDESGDFGVIVGTGGSILHFDGMNWNPVTSPTMAILYDVHGLAADDVVASGQGVILHWNGIDWSIVISFGDVPVTPVLLTSTRIWYGIPNSQFPTVARCTRTGMSCQGLVALVGSVLELQEMPTGDIMMIGDVGDIYSIDDALIQTPVYDHPVGQTMEFTAATVLPSSLEGANLTAYGSNFLGIHRWQGTVWQFVDDPGGTIFSINESPHPRYVVEGVGVSSMGDGLRFSIDGNVTMDVVIPDDTLGRGLIDVAFRTTAPSVRKRDIPCGRQLTLIMAGEEESISQELRCILYEYLWQRLCEGQFVDILYLLEIANYCDFHSN